MKIVLPVCFIYIPGLVLFLLLIRAISLSAGGVSKILVGNSCEFCAYDKENNSLQTNRQNLHTPPSCKDK